MGTPMVTGQGEDGDEDGRTRIEADMSVVDLSEMDLRVSDVWSWRSDLDVFHLSV